jgi:hypothetical protein
VTLFVIPHFTRSIVTRSLLTWAFVRGAAAIVMAGAAAAVHLPPGNPLRLDPVAALLVIAAVGVVGWVSACRRNEDTFLLCLGCGRARQVAMVVVPPAVVEVALAVLVPG